MWATLQGWCWSSPPVSTAYPAWSSTPLTLWYSPGATDYVTCGSAACETSAHATHVLVGRLCYAFNGTGSSNLPCTFSGQSIARGDPAFGDNNYWRGRIWGPHLMILYWALANDDYAGVPGVAEARSALVNQSAALLVQVRGSDDWVWWSSVCWVGWCVCPCGESG